MSAGRAQAARDTGSQPLLTTARSAKKRFFGPNGPPACRRAATPAAHGEASAPAARGPGACRRHDDGGQHRHHAAYGHAGPRAEMAREDADERRAEGRTADEG